MGLKIEQKLEGHQKRIIIKKKVNFIEIIFIVFMFSIFLNPFYEEYINNPEQFSFENKKFLIFFIIIMLMSYLLQYKNCILVIKDLSSGTIDLQKKILKNKSTIFHKDEKIILKLSKIFMPFSLKSQKYILSLNSDKKSIIFDPTLASQLFCTKGRKNLNRRNTQWLFTKEDAEVISRFLEIPLLIEDEGGNQTIKHDD